MSALKKSRFAGSPVPTLRQTTLVASTRQEILENANAKHSASFFWCYHREGTTGGYPLTPLSTTWKSTHKRPTTLAKKYTHYFSSDEGKDPTSLHNAARNKLPAAFQAEYNKSWRDGTVAEFALLIQLALAPARPLWAPEDICSFAISLQKTSPEAFEALYDNGNLRDSPEVRVWVAANQTLGSIWRLSVVPPAPAPPQGVAPTSRKVSFLSSSAGSDVDRGTGSGYFMTNNATLGIRSKDTQLPLDVTKAAARPFHTYITYSLPRVTATPKELYAQCVDRLTIALKLLWARDNRLVVYVFPSKASANCNAKPIVRLWSTAPDRSTLEIYTHQVWLRSGVVPHIRLYVGHIKPIDSLLTSSLADALDSLEISIEKDPIQAPILATCGFLVGSYFPCFHIEYYNALLGVIPRFEKFPIAVIRKNIQTTFGEKIPPGTGVPAAHVLCDASKRKLTVDALKAQFNRRLPRDVATLPDGKFYKFCETATNRSDRLLSNYKQLRVHRCKASQKRFLATHSTITIPGVLSLDYTIDLGGDTGPLTLRQVLLGMKTRVNSNWPLFVSIDYDTYSSLLLAVSHDECRLEADTILSFLPVFLDAKYGPTIWGWFSPTCKAEMEEFCWDPSLHQVVPILDEKEEDAEDAQTLWGGDTAADWENMDDDFDDDPSSGMTFELAQYFNLKARPSTGVSSGFDDGASMGTMATNTSNLTQNMAMADLSFSDDPPGNEPSLPADDLTNVSDITTNSPGSASVASAPANLAPGQLTYAAKAASTQQTGVPRNNV